MSLRIRRLLHWALVVLVALSSLALVDALGLRARERLDRGAALTLRHRVCIQRMAPYDRHVLGQRGRRIGTSRARVGVLALVVGHVMSVITVRAGRRKRAMQ